jgi:hypothetical protein
VADLLTSLTQHREAILLGEFGGLIHMFGKASSEFLRAKSLEATANDHDSHQDLKHLGSLQDLLKDPALTKAFAFAGGTEQLAGNLTDFITKYSRDDRHPERGPDCHLLWLFNTCHRMTSADEKGVLRRKQSISSMRIATPFGRAVRTINPNEIDDVRMKMAQDLATALSGYLRDRVKMTQDLATARAEYLRGQKAVEVFRERAIQILQPGLSQALGETREPANDVTLWAQSWGVASLYKSCLAAIAIGRDPCPRTNSEWDYDKVQWRLLGVC